MKLRQRSEAGPEVFEGSTREEAVALAREALGRDAVVRCWKTRSGGLLGFFAREIYVAGVSAPLGAAKDDEPATSLPQVEEKPVQEESLTTTPLLDLIEATNDEVTLGGELVGENVFSAVLAEAEAALTSINFASLDAVASPPAPVAPESVAPNVFTRVSPNVLVPVEMAPVGITGSVPVVSAPAVFEPVLAAPISLAPESVPTPPVRYAASGERSGLRETLVTLGLPDAHWPDGAEFTFDGLERSLACVPSAPSLPIHAGSLIVVVGSARDAHVCAQQVAAHLGLDTTDVLKVDVTSIGRQRVARRRTTKRVTVLEVPASLRSRDLTQTAAWITSLRPEYVLGAVAARTKCADVEHWRRQFDRLDAVSLVRANETSSPGDLLGKIPIAFIDGAPATTLRWLLLVLHSMVEGER